jgi:heme/copper-type cytochrome/quinol oxidase subunit 4
MQAPTGSDDESSAPQHPFLEFEEASQTSSQMQMTARDQEQRKEAPNTYPLPLYHDTPTKTTTTTTTTTPSSETTMPQRSPSPVLVETVQSNEQDNNNNNSNDDQYHSMDDHDRMAAWLVHISLIVFLGLVAVSVGLAFVVISQYGLVALVFLGILVVFAISLLYFVDQMLKRDARLQPIRRKLQAWHAMAKLLVQDEVDAFKQEWKEYHLLLTNGGDEDDWKKSSLAHQGQPQPLSSDETETQQQQQKKKKKKSVVFRFIQPFLKVKKVFRRKKNKKQDQHTRAASTTTADYEPPAAASGVPV